MENLKIKPMYIKKADNKELKLDIWYPRSNLYKYPLVFFCHGGGVGFLDLEISLIMFLGVNT